MSTPDQVGRPSDERIFILDFGAQYLQLIIRKVQEQGVRAEARPADISVAELLADKPSGLILSGGPASVYQEGAPTMDRRVLEAGIPVLGICYGHQLMAHLLGGKVEPGESREYGFTEIDVVEPDMLLAGVNSPSQTWMSHGDRVEAVPPGLRCWRPADTRR